jgi:thiamine pyrophosphate-dependent acetolactate synthase large subunit-like protein
MNQAATLMPVWREVARAIADMGAGHCFGVVGAANFKVTHALTELGVEFIAARHECGAVAMADVAARFSKELTVASVTAGPGLTNALTAIAEAAKSDTPLLVIAGDVPLGDVRSSFSMRQADLVHAVGAIWMQISDRHTAYAHTMRAASMVLQRRTTVVLSLPIDVQDAEVEPGPRAGPATIAPFALREVLQPDAGQIRALVAAITSSRKPLILAGHGAVVAGAERVLIELADRIGALLATSLHAHGMFAGHDWNLGICGGFSAPPALELVPQSDLILAFGASLNPWTTKKGRLIAKNVAQIDVSKDRLAAHGPVDFEIEGDAAVVATAILAALDASNGAGSGHALWRSAEVAALIACDNVHPQHDDAAGDEYLDPRTFTRVIDEILPKDRVVVVDGGHFVGWATRYLSVPDERGWCIPIAFQSIGLGLASAIGAAVVQPHRLIVLAVGDGGFLMSVAELETAVRLKKRICIVVYNDSAYSAEVHQFAPRGFSTDIARFPTVDMADIARGAGADGIVARSLSDLDAVKRWVAGGAPGTLVLDARINPDLVADWYREIVGSGHL